MKGRLNVLICAYACNPYKGSEEGVGWGWVSAISDNHDLSVITAAYHRADIESALSKERKLSGHIKFYYVAHKPWHYVPVSGWKFIENTIFKPIMNYSYRLWQCDAYKLAKQLHQRNHFDLIHQITYVGFRFPGHLWKLNVPFVWGPIGGLENTPWRFFPVLGLSGSIYYAGRNIINAFHKRFLAGPQKAFKKASGGIISATEGIRREILRWYGEESEVICEIGPPSETVAIHSLREPSETLRLSWSGLHLPGKALPLLLKALVRLPKALDWQLDILGNGPCTKKWKKLSKKLAISDRCYWNGWQPRDKALQIVHNSHIFLITSLKDLTSTVLLEALSQGVPVICPDHCGFSNVVTAECGIKMPLQSLKQFETDLASAILILAEDEEMRRYLAKGTLKRIKDFSWEKKANLVNTIYIRMINTKAK
jgi:glycosyltransferase involved in cell wall biosynthesis